MHTYNRTYTHTHIHTYTYTYTPTHIHTYTQAFSRSSIQTGDDIHVLLLIIHKRTHSVLLLCSIIHTYNRTYTYTRTHTHIHTYTHAHIHTYTHTHIHTGFFSLFQTMTGDLQCVCGCVYMMM
jgi:hypothetical protein